MAVFLGEQENDSDRRRRIQGFFVRFRLTIEIRPVPSGVPIDVGLDGLDSYGRNVPDVLLISLQEGGTHRQVGEVLGLDYWQTEAFLKERGVPMTYSAADLEADEATLEEILPSS